MILISSVEFVPDEDYMAAKKYMVNTLKPVLGTFIFDGMQLFSKRRLAAPDDEVLSFTVKRDNGNVHQVNIHFACEVANNHNQFMQLLNILMKKCLHEMGLERVGRDFYDAKVRIFFFNP